MEDRKGKPKKIKQEKGLGLFCLLGSSDSRLNRSTTFLC